MDGVGYVMTTRAPAVLKIRKEISEYTMQCDYWMCSTHSGSTHSVVHILDV